MASGSDISADAALLRLKEGNDRFVSGRPHSRKVHAELLADLAGGQSPCTTVLGCSDSRVAPEIVFDAPFGDLFVIRVAGNILDPAIAGTLQYAGQHLHTPLFVVLGHEGCGAVQAALEAKPAGRQKAKRIARLLKSIAPGLQGLDAGLPPAERMHAAVAANVRWSMHQILATPEGRARVAEGRMKLVGAVYEIATGRVRFLS